MNQVILYCSLIVIYQIKANMIQGISGKKNQFAETPDYIYTFLDNIYNFDFDPCPKNPQFDGLQIDWGESNYVNPPFLGVAQWLEKAIHEQTKNKSSVFLIPARVLTHHWHKLVMQANEVHFIRGGITFKGYTQSLGTPICLVIFHKTTRQGAFPVVKSVDPGTKSGRPRKPIDATLVNVEQFSIHEKQMYQPCIDFMKTEGLTHVIENDFIRIASDIPTNTLILVPNNAEYQFIINAHRECIDNDKVIGLQLRCHTSSAIWSLCNLASEIFFFYGSGKNNVRFSLRGVCVWVFRRKKIYGDTVIKTANHEPEKRKKQI